MILDTLTHATKYADPNSGLEAGLAFLHRSDLSELPDGKYEIDGDRVFAIIDHADGRRVEEGRLEGHRKYIDIQYIISGDESMGWRSVEGLTIDTDYDPDKDLLFFSEKPESIAQVPPGHVAIFFPEDAHLPLIGSGPIHKVIIKVAV
jgi:biofilm protein TabA